MDTHRTQAQRIDLVGKIGSMALIRREDQDIDYNIFSRLGAELKPGMIWVTSGATEIGRLDYIKRCGEELHGELEQDKADYAAQGQMILMQNYRQFIPPEYSVRQILVEHWHFNDPEKREHLRDMFLRAGSQKAIPIVNYNDPLSDEENRKMELAARRREGVEVHECVDNDETAAVIANLVHAKTLVLMTSTEGIYRDPTDPDTLVRDVTGRNPEELERKVRELQEHCRGASRQGANGARAKLEYALESARRGTTVIIGHARHRLSDLTEGRVACTRIGLE
ncbi:MAG: uridylate kinase [Clostridia bacterium]|nr:uridylate kinase [Clostridia bacterium]